MRLWPALVLGTMVLGGCAVERQPVDPTLLGVFHRPNDYAAENLEIAADHTFRWGHDACDLVGSEQGTWRATAEDARMRPAGAQSVLRLRGTKTRRLEVRPSDEPDRIRVTFVTEAGTEPEMWRAGGTCSDCSGGLRPSGDASSCADPYLGP